MQADRKKIERLLKTATVSLEDKAAYVTLTGEVSDELLKKTVEDEGYQVLEIV